MTGQCTTCQKPIDLRLQCVVAANFTSSDALSGNVFFRMTNESADDLTTLVVYSDDALWAAAESSLSPAQQRRMKQLSTIADTRSLTPAESSELTDLMEQDDRSVFRRAKALSILAQRGHSIPNQAAFNGGSDDGSSHSSTAP